MDTLKNPETRLSVQDKGLARAYAHSDCERARPLFDALDNGFGSVEADIWLVDGELLVAHHFHEIVSGRTLEALYLAPLAARIRRNKGRVYPLWPHSLQLLIDIKSDAESTYLAVHELLTRYKDIFTMFVNGAAHESALTAVISGNRPRALMEAQDTRYAAYDGRLPDLRDDCPASFMPVISDNWNNGFAWQGEGAMPEEERRKLRDIVNAVHTRGRRCRFWATPDSDPARREAVWAELVAAGVDYINTDHLPELRAWLLANDPRPDTPEIDWMRT